MSGRAGASPAEADTPAIAEVRAAGLAHEVVRYRGANSVEEGAELQGIPLAELIKSLVVRKGPGDYLFVLVPGDRSMDWSKLRSHVGVSRMALPDTDEARTVTGYERGTITPLGSRTKLPVVVDSSIASRARVSIGGGARGVSIHLPGRVLVEHLQAAVADITQS